MSLVSDLTKHFDDEQIAQLVSLVGCMSLYDVMSGNQYEELARYLVVKGIEIPVPASAVDAKKLHHDYEATESRWLFAEVGEIKFFEEVGEIDEENGIGR